jgi:hypothetical protein
VDNLRADLALSDPAAEASLTLSWETLAGFRVAVLPDLRVRLIEEPQGTDETVSLDGWLDPSAETFYVTDDSAAGRPSSGGYAIAAVFTEDSRRISHDWVAAWSAAAEGYRAEQITTAARLDAEQKKERDNAAEERLRALSERGRTRRKGPTAKHAASPTESGSGTAASTTKPRPLRLLVEPDELELRNDDGELVGGTGPDTGNRKAHKARSKSKPKDPDTTTPKQSATGGRGPQNYTDDERQGVGMSLVRRVLGGDDDDDDEEEEEEEEEIVDIRHQPNVGADAVDQLKNFFELKVYSGPIPDDVSLTRAEFLRARETDDFFLVVIGNVEQGDADPELRVITDPLGQLTMKPSGSVSLVGVRAAKALRYTFRRPEDEDEDREAPDV